ncbi:MAG: 4-alpha-glucanotransferase [Bacillota bacterium]
MREDVKIKLLKKLARMHGIETFFNAGGCRVEAGPDSLMAVLKAIGSPLERITEVDAAIRERTIRIWNRLCDPVAVLWEGIESHIEIRVPKKYENARGECSLRLERGGVLRWGFNVSSLPLQRGVTVEGAIFQSRSILLPKIPPGYHKLTVDLKFDTSYVYIISAPLKVYDMPPAAGKIWGLFIPLYALNSKSSWGAGDYKDFGKLLSWIHKKGGNMAGTLPLLSSYLDEPFEPSPYSPVSRLFWNEFFIDVTRTDQFRQCDEARDLFNAPGFQSELERLRNNRLVDYRGVMNLKRNILEICSEYFFSYSAENRENFKRWVDEKPEAGNYARFRAAVEQKKAGWLSWPGAMQGGIIKDGDFNPDIERYHLYVQWIAAEQLKAVSKAAGEKGQLLYLDLPLGVHIEGYDTWRQRDIFAFGASVGAPPDSLCADGQNWAFPPLHPENIREQGHSYYIDVLRNHLKYAGILRIDHILGMHRQYWIPRGLPASHGVYVKYRAEEFYAILALESHRHRSVIVGEDLGNVPGYIRKEMETHGVYGMYVLPFEYKGGRKALRDIPQYSLTCLNTHDMLPFAGYWKELGRNKEKVALPVYLRKQGQMKVATSNTKEVLKGCLSYMAASRSRILLVNTEDLWLEKEPQNIPGTIDEYPNWRRRARFSVDEFSKNREINNMLNMINNLRGKPLVRNAVKNDR